MRYTEMLSGGWNAKARLQDMDQDHIDLAVLYPTMLLGLQSERYVSTSPRRRRGPVRYWRSDHVSEGEGRMFGAGVVPPMHEPEDVERVAAEIRRVADLPGMVSVFMRPNPVIDSAAVQRPRLRPALAGCIRHRAADRADLFLVADLPGTCMGLRLSRPRKPPMAGTSTTTTPNTNRATSSCRSTPSCA